jgi:hypothetical protein
MESKQFLPNYGRPTSNNISNGDELFINDSGERFAKTIIPANASSIIVPYDYSKKYEGVSNWNETFEYGGERSSLMARNNCSDNTGGADMSSSGEYFVVWSSSCSGGTSLTSRSYIKVYNLNTEPREDGEFSNPQLLYEAELDDNYLGQNSIYDADISSDGKTLAIAFNRERAQVDGEGFVRIFKWDGVFRGSESNYIKEVDINFCSDSSLNPSGLLDIELNSDGTHLLMSPKYIDAVCVIKNTNNNWVQKGQIIKGIDLNSYLSSVGPTSRNISSNGNRIAIEYYAKDSAESIRGMEIIIYDWAALTEEWKKSGSNITADIGKDLYGASVSINSNGSHLIMHTQDKTSDSSGFKEGSASLYYLPEN